MDSNKLAIVIPYYKLTYFEETLISLQNQTDQRFNLYIGDDASPENPSELIDRYSGIITKYKRFDTNLGGKGQLVEQWNRCISLSVNEDWLMILADDDYLSENFVETFCKKIELANFKQIDLLRFKMRRVTFDNCFLVDLEQPLLYKGKDYLWDDEMHQRFISISENVFRRSVYNKIGFREYPLAWRVPFMMYLDFTNDGDVLGVNESFVAIRRSETQLTRRNDVNQYKRLAMKKCYFDILNEYELSFDKYQNLHFLKIYYYYNKDNNQLKQSFGSLFFKFGGFIQVLKYFLKKIIKK